MRAEHTDSYELHLHKLGLYPDYKIAGDILIATGPEPTVPKPYRAYAQEFSKADSEYMPSHSPQDLVIQLLDGKQLPWGPIYDLSKKKLDTLCSYLEVQLKRGWKRPSKSPASAPVFFVPKKNGTLQLSVTFCGLNQIIEKN
jgi:hypothetical protein